MNATYKKGSHLPRSNRGVLFFFEGLLIGPISVFTNTNSRYFSKTLFINKGFWLKYHAATLLQLPVLLNYIVDGLQCSPKANSLNIQFNSNSMLSDNRCCSFTRTGLISFCLPTVSPIFYSCVWLERELGDFSSVSFNGLIDTRRLLLDYFDVKGPQLTHISNDKNYNNNIFDICLNY